MMNSGNSTHRPRAIDPKAFRNQATGIGQSCGASAVTGAVRSYEVGEHMPARQRRAAPTAEGFDKSAPQEGMAEGHFLESGYE